MSEFVAKVHATLRPRKALTVPEICAALKWERPPRDVGLALMALREQGKAEYAPMTDAGATVPMWRQSTPKGNL